LPAGRHGTVTDNLLVFLRKRWHNRFISDAIQVIEATQQGDPKAADELLVLVYEELRKLAAAKLANEAAGQTLQPTALVHEAWLRLVGSQRDQWAGRAHFFAAAAEAMRRILIEKARHKRALRHGGKFQRLSIDAADLADPDDEDLLLAVHDALDRLAVNHRVKAELVKLRYFVGMTIPEAAQALDISEPTAKNYWAWARVWLYKEIKARSAE